MGKTTKTIYTCDHCHREATVFDTCIACGCSYCSCCEPIIGGCWVRPNVCPKCLAPTVEALTVEYGTKIKKVCKERDAKIVALLKEPLP